MIVRERSEGLKSELTVQKFNVEMKAGSQYKSLSITIKNKDNEKVFSRTFRDGEGTLNKF